MLAVVRLGARLTAATHPSGSGTLKAIERPAVCRRFASNRTPSCRTDTLTLGSVDQFCPSFPYPIPPSPVGFPLSSAWPTLPYQTPASLQAALTVRHRLERELVRGGVGNGMAYCAQGHRHIS